jgi:hypothetical protein
MAVILPPFDRLFWHFFPGHRRCGVADDEYAAAGADVLLPRAAFRRGIHEANQVSIAWSVARPGFICGDVAQWDVDRPPKSHYLRTKPAAEPHMVQVPLDRIPSATEASIDHRIRKPCPGGPIARLEGPRQREQKPSSSHGSRGGRMAVSRAPPSQ